MIAQIYHVMMGALCNPIVLVIVSLQHVLAEDRFLQIVLVGAQVLPARMVAKLIRTAVVPANS